MNKYQPGSQNHLLNRRNFGTGLGASLTAPALILSSGAIASERSEREKVRSLIAISILRRRIALSYLMFQTSNQILGVTLSGLHDQEDENRGSLGGLLTGFQRPTIKQMLDGGTLIASLFLASANVYAVAASSLSLSQDVDKVLIGMRLRIAHGDVSWLAGAFQPLNVTGYPQDEAIEGFRRIGDLWITSNQIALAMIYPVLGQNSYKGF